MRILIVIFLSIWSISSCYSQNSNTIKISERKYTGYIFPADYDEGFGTYGRITPSAEDIRQAESILSTLFDKKPYYKKLIRKNYIRQYLGYYLNGDTILYINLFKKRAAKRWGNSYQKELLHVLDGGDSYWQVRINLTKKKVIEYNINGPA